MCTETRRNSLVMECVLVSRSSVLLDGNLENHDMIRQRLEDSRWTVRKVKLGRLEIQMTTVKILDDDFAWKSK